MAAVEKLTDLKISSHELDELKQNLKKWNTESLAPLLARAKKNPIVLSKRWETLIQTALKFYELAHKRDTAVERALLNWINPSASLRASEQGAKDKEAVLVFGGFHREGITEILRRNGFIKEKSFCQSWLTLKKEARQVCRNNLSPRVNQ